jgi:hypothetical protein
MNHLFIQIKKILFNNKTEMILSCTSQTSSNINFILNVFLHILILFTFLSLFFNFYISKTETVAFQEQIKSIVNDNVSSSLRNLNSLELISLKQLIRDNKNTIDKVKISLQVVDPRTSINNLWIKRMTLFIIISLVILIVSISILLYYSAGQCSPIKELIFQNLIIFAFVGGVEYFFFTRIISNYIPSPPSTLVKTFIESSKKQLLLLFTNLISKYKCTVEQNSVNVDSFLVGVKVLTYQN